MRKEPTAAEKILWQHLRGDKIPGLRFRRQHPAGKYILDFYCHQLSLGIEADGEYHQEAEQSKYDHGREIELQELGITLLRFSNNQIQNHITEVINQIIMAAQTKLKSAGRQT